MVKRESTAATKVTGAEAGRAERTYGQWCPIATGLDVIGDRWTLLICRELTFGDRRFTDLRRALPGLAPNLLTERLRGLQQAGLVESAELPAPAARSVYRLTDEGRAAIVPVLRSVARLGARYLDGEATPAMNALRAASALLAPWARAGEPACRVRLELGPDDRADLTFADGSLVIGPAEGNADVTIVCRVEALAAARRGEPWQATVTGSAPVRRAALERLQLPTPAR